MVPLKFEWLFQVKTLLETSAVLGLLFLLTGRFGADLFLSRTSFLLLAAGIIWMVWGRAMLSQCKFILLVLVLAIPLPAVLFNQITFPLQLLASRVASALLPMAGVPVLREGNVIQLPAMQLEVAEACSGIRSLLSLFTLAVIYGYFLEKSTTRRLLLAIAVACLLRLPRLQAAVCWRAVRRPPRTRCPSACPRASPAPAGSPAFTTASKKRKTANGALHSLPPHEVYMSDITSTWIASQRQLLLGKFKRRKICL